MPPRGELAERSEYVVGRVMANEALVAEGDSARYLPQLEATLASVSERYGASSIESSQALTDAGVQLIRAAGRYDLAEPYVERALGVCREVFGTDHRETGYALHDLAVVRSEVSPEPFHIKVEPLLREAIAVRTRILGSDHKETAGSERTLAALLLGTWGRQANPDSGSALLADAERLLSHALPVMESALGKDQFEVTELRYLQVEVAVAREDFRRAESLARDLMTKHRQPCNSLGKPPSSGDLLAVALRGQGKAAEAQAVERAFPKDFCQLAFDEFVKSLMPATPADGTN